MAQHTSDDDDYIIDVLDVVLRASIGLNPDPKLVPPH
jgi:hypothetical protein